jgi:hypothetical protein
MRRVPLWLMGLSLVGLALGVVCTPTAVGGDIGFVEDFALSTDRPTVLKQLIPGTEEYYYYHCLHYLNSGQFEKVEPLTRLWHQRHNQTPRLTEIQTRYALLTYEKDPPRALTYLKDHLGLRFDHQKEVVGVAPNLPTALDPKIIARDTLVASSIRRWNNLNNFEDISLEWLAGLHLSWEHRRELISRLPRPDITNLPKLVADDVGSPNAPGFGAFPIHKQMTRAQLDELLKLRPDVLNQGAFVSTYLTKLQPGEDDDWKRDRTLTLAYLERLQSFVERLDPVHNALKAHVLFHRLAFDRAAGVYDRGRFLAYLKLPRFQPYMAATWSNRNEARLHPANLEMDFAASTLLPKVGPDEPLVRSYLTHFFADDANTKDFDSYIDDTYLRHLFAEVKITNGIGDPEAWASKLPPELLQQLKDRIDIDFAYTNKTEFAVDEPIKIDLFVKNAPTLLVKVYEINTRHFYRTQSREVDTDINLDGLVANVERVIPGNPDPFRRTPVTVVFPGPNAKPGSLEANRPGVYVIDLIANGKSSRALIRKGRLHPIVTTGTAGQVVRVVDENRKAVLDATVWLGGKEYTPEKDGAVILPFSTAPGRQPIVLSRGDFGCLDFIQHQPENFNLTAGIHVDRESLLTQRVAPVLIRPGLTLNGTPVSLRLLEDVRLRIISTDHDNVPASVEVPNFKLFEDRESIHEIRVPPRLASLSITLTAKVKVLSTGKTVDLSASHTVGISQIAKTDKIEDLHLARFGKDYVVEVLGRTGETKPDRPVTIGIKHRDFKEAVGVVLKTDAAGRVLLGPLDDVTAVSAIGPEGTHHLWHLLPDQHTYRHIVHARAGEAVSLPYLGTAGKPARDEIALFEVRGTDIRADKFDAITIQNGMIELRGLPVGDYDLVLKRLGERIRIRVAAGEVVHGQLLNSLRHLQLAGLKPVQIETLSADKESLTVQLRDASPFTRVHIFATRYQPAFPPFADLAQVRDAELEGMYPQTAESIYLTGRNIGDEYRYVLERRAQKKYPGNMLERPSLLLNPWAVRTTETGEQLAQGGDKFGAVGGGMSALRTPIMPAIPSPAAPPATGGDFADLDFLYDASAVAVNLTPDKEGVIKLPRKDLGTHTLIHVVAIDPLNTTCRSLSLPEEKAQFADLRLRDGLDPARHYTQQNLVSIPPLGAPFVIEDVAGSRFESYDSLARVYGLYATLSKDPKLAEFAFILRWPLLKPEEKRELYSKNACHELAFFVAKKDPEFFATVVKPFLANKKDKTFLDHWFLGDDLARFLKPWEYGRLNIPERVLLARRTAGEPVKTARHLTDLLRLIPTNTDHELFLFRAAVAASALDTDSDSLAVEFSRKQPAAKELEELKDARGAAKPHPGESPAPPAFAAAPAGSPGGGFGGRMEGKPGASVPGRDGALGKKLRAPEPAIIAGLNDPAKQSAEVADLFFADDRLQRGLALRQLFRKLDPTMEWAENNYYKLLIGQQVADLVPVNPFWADYASHEGDGPFLSRHIPAASRNFTEMMFALAVLDLPFTAAKHEVKFEGGKMTLTPASRLIAFHEEVRPADGPGGQFPILVSQNFYRPGDRFREQNGEKYDKFVTGEFIVHTVYGCQVVVTNPTSSRQKLSVLVQMPVGSIPLAGGRYTRSLPIDLEPYRTQTLDYLFYFPRPGKFAHFPVHVARNEQFLAAAPAVPFDVVLTPTRLDTTAWDYVSQHGTNEEVLAYLNRENVRALNLDKIAFRMRDRSFFEAVLRLLQDRHLYHPTLYSYGVFHADPAVARQYLAHMDGFVGECGGPIESPLLVVDAVARHQYEHLEYRPLVNARAHALGARRQIVNDRFHEQYHRFLKTLTYHDRLDDAALMAVTYYLLLQDRIDEASAAFARVDKEKISTRVQYDYCAAYLAMFNANPQQARSIAAAYASHPVDRWRNTFAAITAQVDEIEGRGARIADKDDRDQTQGQLAATEPGFEVGVDKAGLHLTWQNLETVRVNYYLMDVELLFSSNPFVQRSGGQFASIRPNATAEVGLPKGRTKLDVTLPPEFDGRNVLVEVTAGGKTRSVPHFATAMTVNVTENYGQLRVTETAGGKPTPKVYVKVYAKLADGSVKFHKDGYTDLRGRFDYVSVNTPERQGVERFAILVLSEDRGAVIREAVPPQGASSNPETPRW